MTLTNSHVQQVPLDHSRIEIASSTLHSREDIAGLQHQRTELLLDSVLSSGVVGCMFLLVVVTVVVVVGGYLVRLGRGELLVGCSFVLR